MSSKKPSEMTLDVRKEPVRAVNFQNPEIGRNYIYKDMDKILSLGVTELNKGVRDRPGQYKINHSELTVLSPSESQIQQILSAPDYPLGTTSKRKYLRRVSFPQRYPSLVNLVFTDEDIQSLEETFWNSRKGAQMGPAIEEEMREFLKSQAMSKRHKIVKEELDSFRKTSKMSQSEGKVSKKFAKSLTELNSFSTPEVMSKSRRRVNKKDYEDDSLSIQSGSTVTDVDVDRERSSFELTGRSKTDIKGIRKKDKMSLSTAKPKKRAKEVNPIALMKTAGENIREGKTRKQEKFLTYFSPSKLALLGIDDQSVDVSRLDRKVKAMEQMLAMKRSRKKRDTKSSEEFDFDSSGSDTPDTRDIEDTPDTRDIEDVKTKMHMFLEDEDMDQGHKQRSYGKKLNEKEDVIDDSIVHRKKRKSAKIKLKRTLKKALKTRKSKRGSKMSSHRKESELLDSSEGKESDSPGRGSLSMFLDTPTVSDPALDVSKIETVVAKLPKQSSSKSGQRATAEEKEEPEDEPRQWPLEEKVSELSPETIRWKRFCNFAVERRRAEISGRNFDFKEGSAKKEPILMKVARDIHSMWKFANRKGSFTAGMSEAHDDLSQIKPEKLEVLKSAYAGRWDKLTEGSVFDEVFEKSERSESLKKDILGYDRSRHSTPRKVSRDTPDRTGRSSGNEFLNPESQELNESYQAAYGWSRSEDDMPESLRKQLSQEYLRSLQLPWRAHLLPETGKLSQESDEKRPGDIGETEESVSSLRHKKFLEREAARSAHKGLDASDDVTPALRPRMNEEGVSADGTPRPYTTLERPGASPADEHKRQVSPSLKTPERQSQEIDTVPVETAPPPQVVVERNPVVVLNELVSELMGKLEKEKAGSTRRKSSLHKNAMQDLASRGEKFIRDQEKARERSQSENTRGRQVRSSSRGADAVVDEGESLPGKDKLKSRRLHVSIDTTYQEDSEGRRRKKSATRKESDVSEKSAMKKRKDKKSLRETEKDIVEHGGKILGDDDEEQEIEDSGEEGGYVKKSSKISKTKAGTAARHRLQYDTGVVDSDTKQHAESTSKSAEGSPRLTVSAGFEKETKPGDDERHHRRLSKLQERAMRKDLMKGIDHSTTVAGEHWLSTVTSTESQSYRSSYRDSTNRMSTLSTETTSKSIDIFSSVADSQTVDSYPEDDDSSPKKVSFVATITSESVESPEQSEDGSEEDKKRTVKKKKTKKKKTSPQRRRKKKKASEKSKKSPSPPGEVVPSKDLEPLTKSVIRLPEVIIDGHRIVVSKPFSGWDFERPVRPRDVAEQPTEVTDGRHRIDSRGISEDETVVFPGLPKLPEIPRVSQRTESDIYLRKFGIVELFEYMMVNLVMDRPDQPIDYLLDLTRTIMKQMKACFEMSQLLESTIDDESDAALFPMTSGTTFSEILSFKDVPAPATLPT